MYPVTLVISSDNEKFHITSQTDKWADAAFAKPIGVRGVFRYMFNDYPVANIRFGEQEAMATRIYSDILESPVSFAEQQESVVDLPHPRDPCSIEGSVWQIRVRAADGRVRELDLLDKGANVIKNVEYEYVEREDGPMLRRQRVQLPETLRTVGFAGKGVRVKIDDEMQTYSELDCTHHENSRECIVEYQPIRIGGYLASLPTNIIVQIPGTKDPLRCVRLSAFSPWTGGKERMRRVAEEYAYFSSEVLRCREMATKYWFKNPSEILPEDRLAIRCLQTRFEDTPCIHGTVGEQLKQINLLLHISWVLGDVDKLSRYFEDYLSLLAAHQLYQMVLIGGQHVVETTMLWGYLDAADTLLSQWAKHAVSVCDHHSVVQFTYTDLRSGRFWLPVKLMEKVLDENPNDPDVCFEANSLRCSALYSLHAQLQHPERLKRDLDKTQITWVSRSMDGERLLFVAEDGSAKAKASFAKLSEPSQFQKALMAQLTTLEKAATQGNKTNDLVGSQLIYP